MFWKSSKCMTIMLFAVNSICLLCNIILYCLHNVVLNNKKNYNWKMQPCLLVHVSCSPVYNALFTRANLRQLSQKCSWHFHYKTGFTQTVSWLGLQLRGAVAEALILTKVCIVSYSDIFFDLQHYRYTCTVVYNNREQLQKYWSWQKSVLLVLHHSYSDIFFDLQHYRYTMQECLYW